METTSAAQPLINTIEPLPPAEIISQTVVRYEPPLVEMDKPSPQPDISETTGIKVIEHDLELFPKHVMTLNT